MPIFRGKDILQLFRGALDLPMRLLADIGFTLDEIRHLFFGFREGTPASKRWQKLSQRKVAELESQLEQIKTMQHLLRRMMRCCRCDTLDECRRGIFRKAYGVRQ